RRPPETPAEYRLRLARRWPAAARAWGVITESYGAARYGPDAPSDEAVARTRQVWAEAQRIVAEQPSTGAGPDHSDPA
ncbi:MAG TPA: DUF4129 domain-containing protein, partial [Caldilineaceae bacterium]|nr:DUF4129 domain-containing protein [Caldilineaceae bacterium]